MSVNPRSRRIGASDDFPWDMLTSIKPMTQCDGRDADQCLTKNVHTGCNSLVAMFLDERSLIKLSSPWIGANRTTHDNATRKDTVGC